MRKPVVLITGAGGEIGHGLVTRLAAAGSPIITLDVSPLDATLAPLVAREFTGSITDASLLDRMLAEFEVDRVFHLAALLSTRAEFTPVTAHHVNVEGTLNLLEFAQRAGRVARPAGRLRLSVVDCGLRAAGPRDEGARRAASARTSIAHPTTMYGCNKLYCEELGRYYARHYKQLSADVIAARRFPLRPVSRADLGDDAAVGRHVRLRAGDDPRGGARASRTSASSGRTRRFRSWRCRTASTRCWRWRRRRASG